MHSFTTQDLVVSCKNLSHAEMKETLSLKPIVNLFHWNDWNELTLVNICVLQPRLWNLSSVFAQSYLSGWWPHSGRRTLTSQMCISFVENDCFCLKSIHVSWNHVPRWCAKGRNNETKTRRKSKWCIWTFALDHSVRFMPNDISQHQTQRSLENPQR